MHNMILLHTLCAVGLYNHENHKYSAATVPQNNILHKFIKVGL